MKMQVYLRNTLMRPRMPIHLLIATHLMLSLILERIPAALIQKIVFVLAINKLIQLDSPTF